MAGKLITEYLAGIGSIGGKKSRRTLTTAQSKAMVKAREAKRQKKPKASATDASRRHAAIVLIALARKRKQK